MDHIAIDLGGRESQICVMSADGEILLEERRPTRGLGKVLAGRAPGRVDSPPTSMMSAPCSAISTACRTASSRLANCPPSEKLSGVTLRMPISNGLGRVRIAEIVMRGNAEAWMRPILPHCANRLNEFQPCP